jgi:hypothetical protein
MPQTRTFGLRSNGSLVLASHALIALELSVTDGVI